jgi:hypothetical protein
MQIVPRLATLGRVELMMTRPADGGNRRQLPQLSQIEMQEQNDPAFCLRAARQQRIHSSGRLKGINLPLAALLRTAALQKPIRHRRRRVPRLVCCESALGGGTAFQQRSRRRARPCMEFRRIHLPRVTRRWLPRLADDGFEEGDSFKRVFFDGWAKRLSLESGCLDDQPAERKNGGAFWRGPDR